MAAARRLGLIGCGRIGAAVVTAWRAGALPGWDIAAVLVQRAGVARAHPRCTADPGAFFAAAPDLVVEVAGPKALASHGEAALRGCELWTASAAALADDALHARLRAAAAAGGHRLRLLAGAIAGLDGIAAYAACGDMALHLDIDLPPGPGPAQLRFEGTVRDAALRFPDQVNVAVTAALAGPGLDATTIAVRHPGPVPPHRLALRARGACGELVVELRPTLHQGMHPVAANVVAALRSAGEPAVWIG